MRTQYSKDLLDDELYHVQALLREERFICRECGGTDAWSWEHKKRTKAEQEAHLTSHVFDAKDPKDAAIEALCNLIGKLPATLFSDDHEEDI